MTNDCPASQQEAGLFYRFPLHKIACIIFSSSVNAIDKTFSMLHLNGELQMIEKKDRTLDDESIQGPG